MKNGGDFSPAVIDRVATLLDEFRGGAELTLSELSGRTGLPRSSTHRMLSRLVELGWVGRRGRVYGLSRGMFEWGALAQQHDRLHRAAHPILHELHATTGLIVHLAVLEGNDVRYLDKVGYGRLALPSRVGGRQPASRTALGKVLIAHAGVGRAAAYATAAAPASWGTAALPRQEIARIRQQRVAYEREECVAGIACVAAPIGNSRTCVGAVSVTGPVGSVDFVPLARSVRSAAHAIWRDHEEYSPAQRAG
ncbi:IclR family transcriptional regulator [Nocardia grenadensis]|uniref:IclR family transcriptional regulator n=1 Tax=Nocardia grenadensis TaxID=931537 RepID=UPI003D7465C0